MDTPPRRNETLTFTHPDAEIVIGLVCAVGGNYRKIEHHLTKILSDYNYQSAPIKLSDFLVDFAEDLKLDEKPVEDEGEFRRILSFMNAGNDSRKKTNRPELLALSAISTISASRQTDDSTQSPRPRPRTAHILMTLKRPEEADMLRRVYGAGFYLVGVFVSESDRIKFLQDEHGLKEEEARNLILKDADDSEPMGQKTRSTFHRSDVFVSLDSDGYKRQLERFLDLVFRNPFHSPTVEEYGMFMAHAASLRSAQLGRQVGASIVDEARDLVAVGCNEVPRAGGGTYWPDSPGDQRDHVQGQDSNDVEKERIASDIVTRIAPLLKTGAEEQAAAAIRESSLFDITEFGRAVHAEMDALLACKRMGRSAVGATLFTSTFPCHNCARHIVSAGVKRVVYIEPYPKSKAHPLHGDAIHLDGVDGEAQSGNGASRVPFAPFVGIGPRRYQELFSIRLDGFNIERKADGKVITPSRASASPRIPMQPISYLQRERLVAAELSILTGGAKDNSNE